MTDNPKRPIIGDDGELLEPDDSIEILELVPLHQPREPLLEDEGETPAPARRSIPTKVVIVGALIAAFFVCINANRPFLSSSLRPDWYANDDATATAAIVQPLIGDASDPIRTSATSTSLIYDCAWSPDGSQLAVANYRDQTRFWNVLAGTQVFALSDGAQEVSWSPYGMRLLTRGREIIEMWNASTGSRLFALDVERATEYSLEWSPDGTQFAGLTGRRSRTLTVYDATTGATLQSLNLDDQIISGFVWTQGGIFLQTGDTIVRWDTETWQHEVFQQIDSQSSDDAWRGIATSARGQYLALARTSGAPNHTSVQLYIWDTGALTTEPIHSYQLYDEADTEGQFIQNVNIYWSSNAMQFATTLNYTGPVTFWNAETGEFMRTRNLEGRIVNVTWSPDMQQLSICSQDVVLVYNLTPTSTDDGESD